jgi:hypothetical protein
MLDTVVVILEEDFTPNHFAISLACILGSVCASVLVSLNVVEIGLAIKDSIPIWR